MIAGEEHSESAIYFNDTILVFFVFFFQKMYWIQDKGNKYTLGPYVRGSVLKRDELVRAPFYIIPDPLCWVPQNWTLQEGKWHPHQNWLFLPQL